jgi:photosystem II stability/assembly factor-like uncharacterized protein
MRTSRLLFVVLIIALFTNCKKDLLYWQRVVQLNSNTTTRLNNIKFIGGNICIAAGGKTFYQSEIVRSMDGGYTWSSYSDSVAPKEMYGMGLSANGNIYLSGIDGDVLHSRDSGKTWRFNRINNWNVYFKYLIIKTYIFQKIANNLKMLYQ